MAKKTRDLLILSILFLALYGGIYYNFVLVDAMENIEAVQSKIEAAEKNKKALEDDLRNIEVLKRNLEMKNTQNERLEEYLMSAANVTDNIEYVDKLAKLFESGFKKVKIGKPKGLKTEKTKKQYYQFSIDLATSMTYNQTLSFINYVEGGSRKLKVSNFNLKPQNEKNQNSAMQTATSEPIYDLEMTINLYALDLGSIDKIYEYSRKSFNRFEDGDGMIFVPSSDDEAGSSGTSVSMGSGSGGTVLDRFAQNSKNRDIDIRLGSFLIAGQNFEIRGAGNGYPINFRQKDRASVKITFSDDDYHVSVAGGVGKGYNLDGKTERDIITMYVGANFPTDIKENANLGADIQIINNSAKRVDVNLVDKVKRIRITDRNGNLILKSSESEKVYII
ncbi:MAG: hypothetical protein GX270_10585 [Clostridiaceae bacterium]|nr:hypothetical protein [Clostridiaceae bacterium]